MVQSVKRLAVSKAKGRKILARRSAAICIVRFNRPALQSIEHRISIARLWDASLKNPGEIAGMSDTHVPEASATRFVCSK
jgi:hypothetical protein